MPGVLLHLLLIPVAAAAAVVALRRRNGPLVGWIVSGALLYATAVTGWLGTEVAGGQVFTENYVLVSPMVRLGLRADGLSVTTLGVVLLLCTALAIYSIRYVEHRVDVLYGDQPAAVRTRYYARFFALLPFFPVGFIGVLLSTNLVSLYFFLEVLTLALFFLMAFFGYRDRVRIAYISLGWGMVGALLFLVGTLVVLSEIDSLEIAALPRMAESPLVGAVIAIFLVSLMMKLALLPFHVWMPSVHAEHPTCIAGLLAVYANLAVYVLVRICVIPWPQQFAWFGAPLMGLALATMIYGSLLTLAQTDIKRLAACSTISQIAYSVLGLGAGTPAAVEGGLFFFLSHIMGKTVFFSAAGIVVYATGLRDMRQMGGLAQRMPITAALWVIGCLMLSGMPPFSSFTAEWILFTGIVQQGLVHGPYALGIAVGGLLAITLTVTYTFRAARRIFFGPLSPDLAAAAPVDPPWTMTLPLAVVALVSVLLGLFPRIVLDLVDPLLAGR